MGEALDRANIKHQTFRGDVDSHFTYRELCNYWRGLWSFGFVRHPKKWLISRWSHALEHNVVADRRHFGVHREFDSCVRSSLTSTLEVILQRYPEGIYSKTCKAMLEGVDFVLQTELLPHNVYELLERFEGIPKEGWEELPPTNGTSGMEKYAELVEQVPDCLFQNYLDSEVYALELWERAANG